MSSGADDAARLQNLYQICYTQPLIIKDDKLTIEMVFQTTLATNLRQDSRISYLLFSTDNKSQLFDYEATTYLKTPTTLIEGLGFINIFGIFNVYYKEKEFSDKPPLIIHDKNDENIQPLPGTIFL